MVQANLIQKQMLEHMITMVMMVMEAWWGMDRVILQGIHMVDEVEVVDAWWV